jgi:hypothetical protein
MLFLLITIILYCATSLQQVTHNKEDLRFDTDSYKISINNCASFCLTDNKQDFVGLLTCSNTTIKGIRGNQNGTWIGTVKWPVTDDKGVQNDLIIKNTILIPKGTLPFRLLSPQHFGRENFASGLHSDCCSTLSVTYHDTPGPWQQHCHYQLGSQVQRLLGIHVPSEATNRTCHTLGA